MRVHVFKRELHFAVVQLHRHRKFQIVITGGVIASAFAGYAIPHHQELVLVGATLTNLIWIWE